MSLAQTMLNNFINSKLRINDITSINYEQYSKIFKVSQFAMEYYSIMQEQLKEESRKYYE